MRWTGERGSNWRGRLVAVCLLTEGALSPLAVAHAAPSVEPVTPSLTVDARPGAAQQETAQRETGSTVSPKPSGAFRVEYPAGASGDARVELELVVGSDGAVEAVAVIEGREPFAGAASITAKTWRFEPARRDGAPIRVRIRIQVAFTEGANEPGEPEVPVTPATSNLPESGLTVPLESPSTPRPTTPRTPSSTVALGKLNEPIEVVVAGQRGEQAKRLSRAEVRQLPGAFGDPFRALEALPGVTPIVSGLPYFYVRGSPAGNVGYYLDGITVPTLYHAVIGPSVIHPAFIDTVNLYSGAYPARYGRFAGGIVAGETAAPAYEFRGEASLRLVDAGALLEVPFANGRGSVMVGGRYSYTALLFSLITPDVEVGYWDYQGRVVYQLSPADTVSIFGFGAGDLLRDRSEDRTIFDTVFHRLELRYDRKLTNSSALRLAATGGLDQTQANENEGFALRARNVALRLEHTTRLNARAKLRSGVDVGARRFDVATDPNFGVDGGNGGDENTEQFSADDFRALFPSRSEVLGGFHTELALQVASRITLTPGFRFDIYQSEQFTFVALEPRLASRFQLSENLVLLHDLGVAHQAPSIPIPFSGFQPQFAGGLQTALQNSLGVELGLPLEFTASATLFYNLLFNGTDSLSVARIDNGDPTINSNTDRVMGQAHGLELYLRRSLSERLGGFISYTLSRSVRSIGGLHGPSALDRTHVVNVALAYELGRNWRAGTRLAAYSGIPADVGIPAAAVHPPRTTPYYRLDWRLEKRWLVGTQGAWIAFVAEVLNTTLNQEVISSSCYFYGCQEDRFGPVTIPSLGVEAAF